MGSFDKKEFARLLKLAIGSRSLNQFALHCEVSSAHLSRLTRELLETPPNPDTIRKIANKALNGVTYEDLMKAAGHLDNRNKSSFGEKIRLLRLKREMSQRDLAKFLGIAHSTISLYESENREPDHATVLKFAKFFNVSTDFLLGSNHVSNAPHDLKKLLEETELMFDGQPMNEEERESVLRIIEELVRLTKDKNK